MNIHSHKNRSRLRVTAIVLVCMACTAIIIALGVVVAFNQYAKSKQLGLRPNLLLLANNVSVFLRDYNRTFENDSDTFINSIIDIEDIDAANVMSKDPLLFKLSTTYGVTLYAAPVEQDFAQGLTADVCSSDISDDGMTADYLVVFDGLGEYYQNLDYPPVPGATFFQTPNKHSINVEYSGIALEYLKILYPDEYERLIASEKH